jgi:hypothetical protein
MCKTCFHSDFPGWPIAYDKRDRFGGEWRLGCDEYIALTSVRVDELLQIAQHSLAASGFLVRNLQNLGKNFAVYINSDLSADKLKGQGIFIAAEPDDTILECAWGGARGVRKPNPFSSHVEYQKDR